MECYEHVEHFRIKKTPKLIRAETWYIQIYSNHHSDHYLNSKNDFKVIPIAVA
jgi:hypothetical protein